MLKLLQLRFLPISVNLALLVLGLCTRLAATVCGIVMATAFVHAHGMRFTGQGNGELPFMFLGAFVALLLAGGGRYSIDARTGAS